MQIDNRVRIISHMAKFMFELKHSILIDLDTIVSSHSSCSSIGR